MTIRNGVRRLKDTGADIVLVDPQFSPNTSLCKL
jgi:hypothetical protein